MVAGRKYQELIAWQKAMRLVLEVYRVTGSWPREEQYGLTSQIRRAAVSVPANIAEGHGRTGAKEFLHALSVAHGSLYEAETHLLIANGLQYVDAATCDALLVQAAEVGRLIGGLIRSIK